MGKNLVEVCDEVRKIKSSGCLCCRCVWLYCTPLLWVEHKLEVKLVVVGVVVPVGVKLIGGGASVGLELTSASHESIRVTATASSMLFSMDIFLQRVARTHRSVVRRREAQSAS